MTVFGITSQGFNRMLESDIFAALVADIAPIFGVDPTTTDWPSTDSPLSQLIAPFARQAGIVWELAETLYMGGDPDQAVGTLLDALLSLNATVRLEASGSLATVMLSGTEGTLVPAGTRVSVEGAGDIFQALAAATISKNTLLRADVNVATVATIGTQYSITVNGVAYLSGALSGSPTLGYIAYLLMRAVAVGQTAVEPVLNGTSILTVVSVLNGTAYTVTLDGHAITYTSDGSATNAEIVAGVVAAITGSGYPFTAAAINSTDFSVSPQVAGTDWTLALTSNLQVQSLSPSGQFSLVAADLATLFTLAVDSRMSIVKLYTPQAYQAIATGAIEGPAGTLTVIATPVSGFASATNFLDATLGRSVESDDDARIRRQQTLSTGSAATAAIISRLLRGDIHGVTLARVYENYTDNVDADGRPPHTVEVLVQGGDDALVAAAVWETRAGGIRPYGNINANGTVDPDGDGTGITIKDSNLLNQVIHYSRPESIYAFVTVALTLYSEESFPSTGIQAVKDAIVLFGNKLGIGKDFLLQRLYIPINTVPGIASAVITIAKSTDPNDLSPTYGTANIPISARQVLVFDSTRVTVTIP